MIPGRPLLWLTAALLAVALLALAWPGAVPWWQGLALLALAAVALDGLRIRDEAAPPVTRHLARHLAQGRHSEVRLHLANPVGRAREMVVHDHHPDSFEVTDFPTRLRLGAGASATLAYRVTPTRRGPASFPATDLLVGSPWGLWQRRYRVANEDRVRVYPDFGEITGFALLATRDRLGSLGVRRQRRRGEGSDFHQLRDYQRGDSLRQVDWKATSRYRRLISREYQEESDQRVLLVLDCGRHMRHGRAGRAHLDDALNAVLLLAYVAVRQGDAVGLLTFAGANRYLPPQKGNAVVTDLLRQVYDLQPSRAAPDYLRVAEQVMVRQPRRALVVLVTNTRGEEADDLLAGLRLLRRRHLVIVADLREGDVDAALRQPVQDQASALQYQMLQHYVALRRRGQERCREQGAQVIESLPVELPVRLVNQYLAIKESGAL